MKYFLLIFSISFWQIPSHATNKLSAPPCHPDYDALMAIYNSTSGFAWTNKTGWKDNATNCDVCTWHGVSCDGSNRVIGLNLFFNNLMGTIPIEIGNLTYLKSLRLDGNEFTSGIPSQIGLLSRLETLYLAGSGLSGTIPTQIGNLVNLKALWLGDDNLSGNLPSTLGNLSKLEDMDIGHSNINGTIPSSLGNLKNLKSLFLVDNNLSGTIPVSIGNMDNLKSLVLTNNLLTGSIPGTLSQLKNLKQLFIQSNKLTGCFDIKLQSLCGQLTHFDLSNNPGLPGGGNFSAFCTSQAGKCACIPPATPTSTVYQPICTRPTGIIEVTNKWALDSMSLDGGLTYQIKNVVGNLAPGSYSVVIKTPDGCLSAGKSVSISSPVLSASITNLNSEYTKGAASFFLLGSPIGGQFKIDNAANSLFSPSSLSLGKHLVSYSVIQGVCSTTVTKEVLIKEVTSTIVLPSTPCYTITNNQINKNLAAQFNWRNDVTLGTKSNGAFQIWQLENAGTGYYKIRNASSGLYLKANNALSINHSAYTSIKSDWIIGGAGQPNLVYILSRTNNQFLTGSGNSLVLSGPSLLVRPGTNQQYKLNVVTCPSSLLSNLESRERPSDPENQFEIYPNPNSGQFKIRMSSAEYDHPNIQSVIVTNSIGQTIYTSENNFELTREISIDLKQRSTPGVYSVQILSGKSIYVKQVIVK